MRLTLDLCRYWRIPGKLNTGKNRAPYKISGQERKRFVKSLMMECYNEMWLTRPYLKKGKETFLENTFRQKTKGGRLIAKSEKDNYEYKSQRFRINMKPHVKFEDRFAYLIEQKKWSSCSLNKPRPIFEKFAHAALPRQLPDQWPKPSKSSQRLRLLPDNTLTTAGKLQNNKQFPT